MSVNVITGDCRDVLATLPAQSAHCCVTSPPYFGLRDYGMGAQIGLEPTPDAFIAELVAVFREVRRVLRDDGVLFVNIGDSYHSSGPRQTGRNDTTRETPGGRGGSFREGVRRVIACDTPGKALEGSQERGCFCQSLCGACRAAYQIGKSHNDLSHAPTPSVSNCASSHEHRGLQSGHLPTSGYPDQHDRNAAAILDPAIIARHEGEPLPGVQASTTQQSSPQFQATCSEERTQGGECQLCARSLQRSAQESAHKAECICGSVPLGSVAGNQGTGALGLAYQSYTTASPKPKDLIGIPWMLAFALRADGWYLRQEIIWHKPNPMPESVTDRCTKAHESLFLLSKRPTYYFDAAAIAETAAVIGGRVCGSKNDASRNDHDSTGSVRGNGETRNKRSVWTVPTQPYSGAHFATFPPALIEPCILAGCPAGGMVLDPFGGAGTTGLVADRLQRSATLIELNPEYAGIAQRRIGDDAPLFGVAA